jgi:hypothetical protein
MTIAIPHGDATEAGGADPTELFLKRITDADDAIQTDEGTHEDHDDEDAVEVDEDAEELSEDAEHEDSGEDDAKPESKTQVELNDDAVVKVKVDGEEKEFSLASLKRLAGQEAALNRKQQEAAEIRKRADEAVNAYAHSLMHLREKAVERFKPFEGTNLLLMSKHLSAEDLALVTEQAQAARADLDFFDNELRGLSAKREQEQQVRLKADAEVAWKTLSDPEKGIPNWNMNLYNDLLGYCITDLGMERQQVLGLVDANAWKIIHDSYSFRKGQKALVEKAKPVAKTAKKQVIKSSSTAVAQTAKPNDEKKLLNRLRQTGDANDAADLFFARATRK